MPEAPAAPAAPFDEERATDALRNFVSLVISIAATSMSEEHRGTFNCDAAILLSMPNALLNLGRAGFFVADLAAETQLMLGHSLVKGLLAPNDLCVSAIALEAIGWQHDDNSDADAVALGHFPDLASDEE
jgi:hypothetical protein